MLIVGLLAAGAGYSQGLTGFGFALVFTPLASLLLPVQEVVLSAVIIGGIMGVVVVLETLRWFPWRRSGPLVLSAAVGAPIGVAMLAVIDASALRVVIAITALSLAAAFVIVRPAPFRREAATLTVAGVLGGFLNGCTSMGGPPAALAIANQRWGVIESRGALAMFNLVSFAVGLVFARLFGILHGGSWLMAGILTTPAVVGTVAGALSARRIAPDRFRKVLVGAVVISALLTLLGALWQR
ncbi:MAG: sulfite exporter TauE/SafE family protein [Vulcanimicrobiaceae bacterium]